MSETKPLILRESKRKEWINHKGAAIHPSNVAKIDKQQEWVVEQGMKRALKLHKQIVDTKTFIREAVKIYLDTLATVKGEPGDKWPENTGATLYNYDKTQRIILAFEEKLMFNNELQLAKPHVDDFIENSEESKSLSPKFKEWIKDRFKVNRAGYINIKGLHTLLRTDFDDDRWKKAQEHVRKGIESGDSVAYYIFEVKDPQTGEWVKTSLNFSRY